MRPRDTWKLAKNIYKLKEKEKRTFFSPTNEWSLQAASTIKPKEREFVVDSGASMHMVSRRDLNKAEKETVRISKNTDNGRDSQRRSANERRGNGKRARIGVIRDDDASRRFTSSSFTRKLGEDHGYYSHWTSGQKPHLIKNGRKIECHTANNVPFVVPGLSTSSSSSYSPTFPVIFSHAMNTHSLLLITLHGSRMCWCASSHLHGHPCVRLDRLFTLCSSPCSFPCVSPILSSST